MVGTDAGRHMKDQYFMARCLMPCMFFMIKTPFYGAQTTLYCALEDTIEDETGCYYSDCSKKEPSGHAQDMEAAKRLWEVSETLVGLKENV
jgi:retinol dehydrogenase-12